MSAVRIKVSVRLSKNDEGTSKLIGYVIYEGHQRPKAIFTFLKTTCAISIDLQSYGEAVDYTIFY